MKKLAAALVAVVTYISLTLVGASPASAEQYDTKCTDNGSTCMEVAWRNLSGSTGVAVDWLYLTCNENAWSNGWDHPADDGHYIRIYKGSPGLYTLTGQTWDDAHSNLDFTSITLCQRQIYVNQSWNTPYVLVEWDFTEQRNFAVDYEHLLSKTLAS